MAAEPDPDPTAIPLRGSPAAARRLIAATVAAGAHPGYETIEASIDGRLAPRSQRAFDLHLRWCARCAREAADLARHAPALRRAAVSRR